MNRRAPWVLLAVAAVCLLVASTVGAGPAPTVARAPASTESTASGSTRAVQGALRQMGYSIVVDGWYGPQTTRAVRHWQRANGLEVDGISGPITMASLGLGGPAPAVRVDPPDPPAEPAGLNGLPFAPADLSGCDMATWYRVQAGLPDQFDPIIFRESRCRNDVTSSTGCCHGALQNYLSSHLSRQSAYRDRIINDCQTTVVSDIKGTSPLSWQKQMCVSYVVWSISGMSPWAL